MISHGQKFLYVHINKTAGTSIDSALRKYAQHDNPAHQLLVHKLKLRRGYRNSLLEDCVHPHEQYFKFTIVRNPWDWLVSGYFFHVKKAKKQRENPFSTWLKSLVAQERDLRFLKPEDNYKGDASIEMGPSQHLSQLDWISDDKGVVGVDFIGRFENIQEDFSYICKKIGVPRVELPHLNATAHKPYHTHYDDETIELVMKKYNRDIEYFGYKFGE